MIPLIVALIIGYLIGSLPFGYFLVRWTTGQDVTQVASGRTGATNSFRAGGWKVGVGTALFDVAKGAIAVAVTMAVIGRIFSPLPTSWAWVQVMAGIGSVIGHNYSCFLGFKGGAGTTPNVGWATYIWWPNFFIGLLTALLLFYATGMASVVSLAIGAFLPIVFGIRYFAGYDSTSAYFIGSLITMGFVSWALRPNIARIIAGEERVVGPRAKRLAKKP